MLQASTRQFQVGDPVVFVKTKHSLAPGPRAREVTPARGGDSYTYVVDKLWVVDEVNEDQVTLRTRRGKLHEFRQDDERLRHPTFWERLRYFGRFPR